MIIDHLTTSGSMDPGMLYEPPYTDEAPNGVGDVFELKQVQSLVSAIRSFEPRHA
jgi:type I restriction enzyme R subunit